MLGRERIWGAAYQCLLEQQWHTLPVEPARFQLPFPVVSFQEYAQLSGVSLDAFLAEGYEGLSVVGLRDSPILLFNDQALPSRARFTIAHELGHLFLCHQQRTPRHEDEANLFASALLMPDALLELLRTRGIRLTEQFLAHTFGVSRNAARRKRAGMLTPALPHPLDQQIEALFVTEISRLAPLPEPNFAKLHDRYLDSKE